MSGFDPEAIFDAIAELIDPDTFGVDVHAFMPSAPTFPVLGIFPGPRTPFIDYWGTFGDSRRGTMQFQIRTAFTYSAENSLRQLFQLMASGSGHSKSLIDTLMADPTLGGLVQSIFVGDADVVSAGQENAQLFEAVWTGEVVMKREAS